MNRDPFDVYSERRDQEDERLLTPRELIEAATRGYVVPQVHIGFPELKDLLTFRFQEIWQDEIGDRDAGYSEAEHVLHNALASALSEIQEVRALALEGEARGHKSPDGQGGPSSSPGTAPSVFRRFFQRITRSPWL